MKDCLLTVTSLTKKFGGLRALEDIHLCVGTGEIVGLIGPNGAGKTTLFNCITGYDAPSRGQITFRGRRIDGLSPDRVCKLGMVRTWQKVRPLAKLTVKDNVMVGALARTHSLREAAAVALEQLELVRLDRKALALAGGLSIGERKRLEVARALATGPSLLLLDEVMGGLNPAESEEIIQLVLELRRRGLTLMVIEHDMKAIMRISDRVVVLNSGEKLAEGRPEEVVANPAVIAAYLGAGYGE